MAVHLSVRSHYSLLNGLMSVEEVVKAAKEAGYSSVALTEHRVLFSALDFYYEATKQGIKPIFGLEVKIEDYYSLVLAKNNKGFQALQKLSYILSSQDHLGYEDLIDYQDDLILIVYSENGPFEKEILNNNWDAVSLILQTIKQKYHSFYLGISHQESNFFKKTNENLAIISENLGIECVAVPKVYYKNEKDADTHRALRAIDEQKLLNDQTLLSSPGRYFLDNTEFESLYPSAWIKRTDIIAQQCNVNLLELKTSMPRYVTNHDVDNSVFLTSLSEAGLKKRCDGNVTAPYRQRLDYELDVINSMGFTDYFLIVYDVIRYAKQNGINVGPGRGSSAGSLIAYCLGITDVDPIEYHLLFERFLNPERLSMPDIDIDFPDNRRDEVVNYAINKYGSDHVAQIIAFGSLKARQSFRDSGRILNVPIHKINQAAKMISLEGLDYSYKRNNRFALLVDSDKQLQQCFELAKKIEGTPRHVTQHAAGIVFSDRPLLEVAPLYAIDDTLHVIQYDMTHIESMGLIKMDFLGIRNLSIIDRISTQVRKQNQNFKIQDIPLDDRKTYDLVSKGETIGVFQLESDGMINLLKRLKPNKFMDLVDTIALYRPGPMENIPLYLENRTHPDTIEYYHEDLKEIIESTYGIFVYQEQIMQAAQKFAGFSLGKADILRRAMSKKNEQELKSMEQDFIDGAVNQGYERVLAQEIFDLIYKFANYGFNKSHSVAYGLVAYQLAYLKANYPELFYTELLTSVIGDDKKTKQYIDECRRRNVLLLAPNLDKSTDVYQLESQKIRLPFTIIKGISKNISQVIMKERIKNGSYLSFYQAIVRLNSVGITQKQVEKLVGAGAFDYFGYNRASLIESLTGAYQYANLITIKDDNYIAKFQYDLVSEPKFSVVSSNQRMDLANELALLGFYLSDHPAQALKQRHKTDAVTSLIPSNKSYRVIAQIDRIKLHRAKNGKMMAFLVLSDDTGIIDGVVFPNVYAKVEGIIEENQLILIKGNVKEEGSFLVNDIHIFKDL